MQDVTVTPAEIRQVWTRIQAGENRPFERAHPGVLEDCVANYGGERVIPFIGASGAQIEHRLNHGYEVESKSVAVVGAESYETPSWDYSDETGDLIVDMALAGEEFYRVEYTDLSAPKSLNIRVCMGMHAGTSAAVIGAYMEWVLKIADAAMRDGYVPSIDLWIGSRGGYVRGPERVKIIIPLVKAGEVVDVTAWRAYLTPGAFRSLGFVAMGIAGDKIRRTLKYGYGSPTNAGWRVQFDSETNTLDIECPGGADRFPEDLMDEKLAAAYAA